MVNTSRSFPHSWRITWFVTRLTRRVQLVEQELPTLPEHLTSPPPPRFSGVRVTRSLVLCVCFVDRCLSFFFLLVIGLSFDWRILITTSVSSNSFYYFRGMGHRFYIKNEIFKDNFACLCLYSRARKARWSGLMLGLLRNWCDTCMSMNSPWYCMCNIYANLRHATAFEIFSFHGKVTIKVEYDILCFPFAE